MRFRNLTHLPNLLVVAPGDPVETRAATRAVTAHPGPVYLRLGKAGEPTVHQAPIAFELGKAIGLRDGSELTIMSTGGMLHTAMQTAERLAAGGMQARVLSMYTLKPLDTDAVQAAARDTGAVFTLEEHSIVGGLGSAVAECLAERSDVHPVFKRLGLPSAFSPYVGLQQYLLEQHGLSVEAVAAAIRQLVKQPRRAMELSSGPEVG